jgi:hypothetical protein
VVVAYPDGLFERAVFDHRVAERLVDLSIGPPTGVVVLCVGREVVEQRPDGLVAEALIVSLHIVSGKKDGNAVACR